MALLRLARRARQASVVATAAAVASVAFATPAPAHAAAAPVAAESAPTAKVASSMTRATYADRVHRLVNKKRKAHDRRPLKSGMRVDAIAQRRAQRMLGEKVFDHFSLGPVLRRTDARWAGEVMAKGPFTPRQIVRMWMQEPIHRAIVLKRKPNRIGVGVALTAKGEWLTVADLVKN
ncbi:CAP domain-containing protein [Nocardioides sp. YIM 152588]|uniref:CAP domain-containing protein n=1 Tax=Nocardioides sp. YIM 152588 TaxID=3158259 RepID=UPI0032E4D2A1